MMSALSHRPPKKWKRGLEFHLFSIVKHLMFRIRIFNVFGLWARHSALIQRTSKGQIYINFTLKTTKSSLGNQFITRKI